MSKVFLGWGFISFLIVSLYLESCFLTVNEPVDIMRPSIEIHQPEDGTYLEAGSYISFEATFKDDLELGSYSIDIHDNLDGHTHGRIALTNLDPSLIKWSLKRNYTIPEGLIIFVAQHDDDIEIPENTLAGPYDFILQAVDQAGNATNYQDGSNVQFGVYITNDSQPVITITNLINNELEIEAGLRFMVEGHVTDSTSGTYAGMNALEVILGEDETTDHQHDDLRISQSDHTNFIDTDFEDHELDEFTVNGEVQLDLIFESINFVLSQQELDELLSENVDHLMLTISVRDAQGNVAVSKTVVHIHFE